ncbi:hypothetical protein LTR70_009024 [Exophiala xenobiotica]|uniref:glucose oxidase n=1 Tax=Lithohypha guttulata TaxID=1690604 RepID=A0ABR0JZU5_9EURO|nr:hypothetical protein LTR24_008721 [Lithohypha guttulata]KAK5311074.1 hypothetical protein LTR70_009024 [Exophiala xenobiotica]
MRSTILAAGLYASFAVCQDVTYDYVIAGAGTAGLVCVVLSENPNISVMVLEAGNDGRNQSNITDPERRGTIQHTQYDWGLESTLQQYLYPNGTGGSQYVPRGKTIGGTSAMNWMIHNENSRTQLDIWESLLNLTGWNWTSMSTAFRESETMYAPPAAEAMSLPYNASVHGGAGPICSIFQRSVYTLFSNYVQPSLVALGYEMPHDGNNGNANGPNFLPLAICPQNYTRSYAGSAYTAVQTRQNLHVIESAHVSRIVWGSTDGRATASGLEYIDLAAGSTTQTVKAREIVPSGGIVYSPQILQLSGIGDPQILSAAGVNTIVNLTNVGTSLRDPPMTNYWPISFQLNETAAATANLTGNEYIQNLIDLEPASQMLSPEDYTAASTFLNSTSHIPGVADAQFAVFKHLWFTDQPLIEMAWQYTVANVTPYNLIPLSQGTVHINSSNPLHPPAIDPNYNSVNVTINGTEVQWDMWFLAKASQYYVSRLATTEPMASLITGTTPDYRLPFNEWYDAIFQWTGSSQHLTGGNPMLPRDAGGVVDTDLLVYGTNNVRVVDGSVFPYQPSAHPMGVTYALAVRAARIFQGLNGGGGLTATEVLPSSNVSASATATFPANSRAV